MSENADRLYELLPAVYRQRDAERGWPLKAFLRVIAEQVDVVEDDVAQLYENWFIETCEDWVVPYLGDLIGYRPVHEAGEPGDPATASGRDRNKTLVPRREVANTVRYRRRKGTLALLELLARDVADWPARAVELCALLVRTRDVRLGIPVEDPHGKVLTREQRSRGAAAFPLPGEPPRGGTVDLRRGDALDRLGGPFDELAHTVDVRRLASRHRRGLYGIPNVGLFVWRLGAYSVTGTAAYCLEDVGPHCYTFSVLGNDTPLFTRPESEADPTAIAGELNVPAVIRRRRLEHSLDAYYGTGKSLLIWEAPPFGRRPATPIDRERLVVADLSGWHYRPLPDTVAVDPVLGRIAFPPGQLPKKGVWVSYLYGFSADMGGGEYRRGLSQSPAAERIYRVGDGDGEHRSINRALRAWKKDAPGQAVIELASSSVYVEQLNIVLERHQSLVLRAAERTRPVIRLLDWQTGRPDSLSVRVRGDGDGGNREDDEYEAEENGNEEVGEDDAGKARESSCARFVLDGLLVTGRGVQVRGNLADLEIRHSTLVPGWSIDTHCEPRRPNEPSLELYDTPARVRITRSIVGTLQVNLDEVAADPIRISIADSILDATDEDLEAIGAPGCPRAHVVLDIRRSTVFGRVQVHAVDLGENCLFLGRLDVARRQRGCLRFSYVDRGSRTPRRYRCQPDLAIGKVREKLEEARKAGATIGDDEALAAEERAVRRVRPCFTSTRYGTPAYCRLDRSTAGEIRRGADDESEMGAFHHLFQPQREAILSARLQEYTPADAVAGILFAPQHKRPGGQP